MTKLFIKHAVRKANRLIRKDLAIVPVDEKPILYMLVQSENYYGYVKDVGIDTVTAEFGCDGDSKPKTLAYSELKVSDFRVIYISSQDRFVYPTLVSYYVLHRWPIVGLRQLINKLTDKFLVSRSLKKTEFHKTVEQLVVKATMKHYGKASTDEFELLKDNNPWITKLHRQTGQLDEIHQDYTSVSKHYRLILDALVESGDLEHDGMGYAICPQIYLTYQKMDSEHKRHRQIFWITLIASLASLVSAATAILVFLSKN
ncbi:hypothetical protein [Pseudidiomarina aestuarii]|uniref:hypothetical protein n=1 Tax=Pseudidiomarina aestuarii TaxID=624146 RepID=UPI003A974F3C